MEPEQIRFGYLAGIAEYRRDRRRVLRDGVAAGGACGRSRCPPRRRDDSRPGSSRRAAGRRPTGRGRSDGPAPSGGAGRAASCSRPRASRDAIIIVDRRRDERRRRSRTSCAPTRRRWPRRAHVDPRRGGRTRTSWPGRSASRVQLRSVPMLATPAMPVSRWPSQTAVDDCAQPSSRGPVAYVSAASTSSNSGPR